MFSRKAITKMQAIIIVAIISVAAITSASYWYVTRPAEPREEVIRLWTDETSPEAMTAFGEVEHDFESAYPDLDLRVEFLTIEAVYQKLLPAIEAGTAPDVCIVDPIQAISLALEGKAEDVTDVIDEIGRQDFLGKSIRDITVEDKQYGVPSWGVLMTLFVRQDWLDEKGLSVPTTWGEMLTVAEAFTDPSEGRYGWSIDYADVYLAYWFVTLLWMTDNYLFDEQGNLSFDNPGTRQALQFLKEMHAFTPPGAISDGYYEAYMRFVNGEVGLGFWYGRVMSLIDKYNPEIAVPGVNVTVTAMPTAPGGNQSDNVTWESWLIPKPCKNPEGAKTFLVWFESHFADKAKVLHAVPGHLVPSKLSDSQNQLFWDNPAISKWSDGVEAEVEALEYSLSPAFEHGELQEHYMEVLYSDALMDCIQYVVTGERDIETAVNTCNTQLEELLAG